MVEPYWWYVLFVRSNSEARVVADFGRASLKHAPGYEFDAFYLESESYFRKGNADPEKRYIKRPLLPGYVIVETDMPAREFLGAFSDYIRNSNDIYRLLRAAGCDEIALPAEERKMFEYLYRGKRCLERSVGCMIGDRIVVDVGPLKGREGFIRHVNRHNRDAVIEMEMFGKKITARVALEIVSKI